MGSRQSTTGNSETYTIDPSGKIARVSRNVPNQPAELANKSETEQAGEKGSSHISEPIDAEQGAISGGRQQATLNIVTLAPGPSDQLRLQEMDEILTRMKAKYKPNSTEMAGKSKSVFEEIEKRLIHCYRVNRDQALKCATLSEEYRSYVDQQRAQTLVNSAKS